MNKIISIKQVTNTDLSAILNEIGQKLQIQFVLNIKKPIYIKNFKLDNISLLNFLEYLKKNYQLNYFMEGNTIFIKENDNFLVIYPISFFCEDGEWEGSLNEEFGNLLKNKITDNKRKIDVFWIEIEKNIKMISNDNYAIDKYNGIINIFGDKTVHQNIKEYLKQVTNKLYQQILIECKVIEIRMDISENIDLQPLLNSVANFANGDITDCTNAMIKTCRDKYSYTKIHASSQINLLTMNRVQAKTESIQIKYFSQKEFKYNSLSSKNNLPIISEKFLATKYGFTLSVIPIILEGKYIVLKINPSLSVPLSNIEKNDKPVNIQKREFKTIIKSLSGINQALGGLYLEHEESFDSNPSLFGKSLKKQHKKNEKSYFILIIKATIIEN